MSKYRICFLLNYPPHYRYQIYSKIASSLPADFYFGDYVSTNIKKIDVSVLKGFQLMLKTRCFFGYIFYYSGVFSLLSKGYSKYVLTGDISNISTWFLLLYCKTKNKKCYLWTHGLMYFPTNRFKRTIHKLYYRLATGVLVYCEHAINNMINIGISKESLFPIHNSLDSEKMNEFYRKNVYTDIYRTHFNNNFPTIIYIGRIQRRKKINQIFEAISILKQRKEFVNCVLVGNNVDDLNVAKLPIELGIESQIWFYGPSYDEAINSELLYNAAVCVSPGNVGLTSIHSLSYGTPVITHNNFDHQMPEYMAIEDGVTGTFYTENNIEELANAIEKWINLTEDDRALCRKNAVLKITNEWSVTYQLELLQTIFK